MKHLINLLAFIVLVVLFIGGCSPKISGVVRLYDNDMQPIEVENPKGTVINMMNTTASLEKASHSVVANELGEFESEGNAIKKGTYKVEVRRIGFITKTKTVELGTFSHEKLEIGLQQIPEGKRKSIEASRSDKDKIINPGEVNIQPPMM
jgi:hypothetical protein